jgi:hypothetical protein
MGDSNILDPAEVNGVVHVVLLVDIARQNRDSHFERRAGHGEEQLRGKKADGRLRRSAEQK